MQIDANHLNVDNNIFSKLSAAAELKYMFNKSKFELEKLTSIIVWAPKDLFLVKVMF